MPSPDVVIIGSKAAAFANLNRSRHGRVWGRLGRVPFDLNWKTDGFVSVAIGFETVPMESRRRIDRDIEALAANGTPSELHPDDAKAIARLQDTPAFAAKPEGACPVVVAEPFSNWRSVLIPAHVAERLAAQAAEEASQQEIDMSNFQNDSPLAWAMVRSWFDIEPALRSVCLYGVTDDGKSRRYYTVKGNASSGATISDAEQEAVVGPIAKMYAMHDATDSETATLPFGDGTLAMLPIPAPPALSHMRFVVVGNAIGKQDTPLKQLFDSAALSLIEALRRDFDARTKAKLAQNAKGASATSPEARH